MKDVHTEHCCKKHGCKYTLTLTPPDSCTVVSGEKEQSFPCEDCGPLGPDSKTITVHLSKEAYNALRRNLQARWLTAESGGAIEAFTAGVVEALMQDQTEVIMDRKKT